MKLTTITSSLVAALVTGCASPRIIKPHVPFDAAAAQRQLADGPNGIKGSALIRQNGGGVVTCAGETVFLMPATDAASEWAVAVYGSRSGGFHGAMTRGMTFEGRSDLFGAVRSATCDAQGSFKFDHVADGTFYVFTRIVWTAGMLQGGSIMRAVTLSGGQSVDLVLSPAQ